ncbi:MULTISPECIES: methionine adenosyltransferase [unclassified Nitratiruptor]|uniref:methionine adenosyltransferase n=1 Tax=unclassified Nitratiruptor TaxID=2624044 RepID=UPI001915E113|nr:MULTISPECIES: methionine adenosyltransferase [unclassified Nitratiruptor]BCD60209.1 S-adenosylmethionine synthetase [Nitratiruptor sp. YY08-10]BCD64302.1 S-adenosylmethionine synthetase [Nitratiruptor sp. YY08-14]
MYLFTCESVSPGHPDKCADIIADTIVDALLEIDPNARLATEVFIAGTHVVIGGEYKIHQELSKEFFIQKAMEALEYIGYPEAGFTKEETLYPKDLNYHIFVNRQSPDISQGVDKPEELGAGDQGIMIGYATSERGDFMPYATMMARELRDILYHNAKLNPDKYGIDIKTEVVLDYGNKANFEANRPQRVDKIIVAQSHVRDFDQKSLQNQIRELIEQKCSFNDFIDEKTEFIINGTGKFVIHGPIADSGLTGRKIVVDNYGPYVPIGGGAQSSKDYTKVDRSAHYAARWIAKHIVASGLAKKAQVALSYVIGRAKPLQVTVDTFGTGKLDDEKLSALIADRYELSPYWIMQKFSLHKPQGFSYKETAAKGQVGYENYPWEQLDEIEWFRSL